MERVEIDPVQCKVIRRHRHTQSVKTGTKNIVLPDLTDRKSFKSVFLEGPSNGKLPEIFTLTLQTSAEKWKIFVV